MHVKLFANLVGTNTMKKIFTTGAAITMVVAGSAMADSAPVELEPIKLNNTDFEKIAPLSMDNNFAAATNTTFMADMEVGDCYMKVEVPAQYETVKKQILLAEAGERIVVTEPKYKEVKERILVQEASFRLEATPAKFKTVSERVMVSPEREEWRVSRSDDIYSILQNGSQLETRVDSKTGETLCKIKVPAKYKTVSKKVMVNGPSTRRIEIPAKYTTITKRVLVEEATEVRKQIPAKFQTVSSKNLVSSSNIQWVPVLCRTNMTLSRVKEMQSALKNAGFYEGPIDGIYGYLTTRAITRFQKQNGMPTGGITMETLQKLGLTQ